MPHFLKYSPLKQQNKPNINVCNLQLNFPESLIIRCFAIFGSTNWQSKINIKIVRKKYIEQKTVCKITPQQNLFGWLLSIYTLDTRSFWCCRRERFDSSFPLIQIRFILISIKRARLLSRFIYIHSVNRSAFVKKSIFNY